MNSENTMSRRKYISAWTDTFMKRGRISYEIAGETAIFTDPVTGCGGEKCTMEIPSREAVLGITKAIFWKPAFNWVIDRVRVMNPISTAAEGQKLKGLDGHTERAYYTYLKNVRYQVEAHFEFNTLRPQFAGEWGNPKKYYAEAVKAVMQEGRYSPFLGKSECAPSYIRLCSFGEGDGYYDGSGTKDLGFLYWGLTYPDTGYDEESLSSIMAYIWNARMVDGVVVYPAPDACIRRKVRDSRMKHFPNRDREEGGPDAAA